MSDAAQNENNNQKKNLLIGPNNVSIHDLLFFKEEVLKDLRTYQNKVTNNIKESFNKYDRLVDSAAQKLNYYEKDKSLFMTKLNFLDERNNLLSEVGIKIDELNKKITLNETQIKSNQKDFANACYRYDKIILDNLLIPNLIGSSCRFANLKEYLLHNKEEFSNAINHSKQMTLDFSNYRKKVDNIIREININIGTVEGKLRHYIDTKFNEVTIKLDDMSAILNSKIDAMYTQFKDAMSSNIDLKNFFIEKNKSILEENKKACSIVLDEFKKEEINMRKMKKNILSLSNLLLNRHNSNNKQQIIQKFLNMIMKIIDEYGDINKHANNLTNLEAVKNAININKKISIDYSKNCTNKISSRIKDYIEGKIQAEDTKYMNSEQARKRKSTISIPKNLGSLLALQKDNNNSKSSPFQPNENNNNNISRKKTFLRMNTGIKTTRKNNLNLDSPFNFKNSKSNNQTVNNFESNKKNENNFNLTTKNFASSILNKHLNTKTNVIYEEKHNLDEKEEKNNNKNRDFKRSFTSSKIKYQQHFRNNSDLLTGIEATFGSNYNNVNSKLLNLRGETKGIEENEKSEESSDLEISKSKFLNNNEKTEENNEKNENKVETKNKSGLFSKEDENISLNKEKRKTSDIELNLRSSRKIPKSNTIIDASINNKNDNKNDIKTDIKNDIKNVKKNDNKNDIKNENDIKSENKTDIKNDIKIETQKSNSSTINNENNKREITIINNSNNINAFSSNSNNKNIEKIEKEKQANENTKISTENNIKKAINNCKLFKNTLNNYLNCSIPIKLENQKSVSSRINNDKNTLSNGFKSDGEDAVKITLKKNLEINKLKTSFYKNIENISTNNINLKKPSSPNAQNKPIINNSLPLSCNSNRQISHYPKLNNIINNNNNFTNSNNNIININKILAENSIDKKYFGKKKQIKNNIRINNIKTYYNDEKNKYVKDEDIIDVPLLMDKTNFKLDSKKGDIENKILELEYFTKKKFDELVREIKNFIPIHFNSRIKDYTVQKI